MMDDQILLADRREDIAAMIAHALGMARHVGHEFQIGPVEPRQLRQFVHRQHAVDQEHLVVGHGQRALHERAQLLRHRRLDFEADHRSATAALQRRLEHAHKIFRLFLDFEFRVADDAERALPLHRVAGKQPADEQARGLLQRHQPHRLVLARRQTDEAVDLAGHADQRVHRLAVGDARKLQRDREAEVRNERERMRRIDRQRRQQRKDVVKEVILDPGALGFRHVPAFDQHDTGVGRESCAGRARSSADRLQARTPPR